MSKESLPKIVEKIKKLLALGESPNKEEAQTAVFRAQQLIEKYNVEESLLEDEENQIVKIELVTFDCLRGIPRYYTSTAWCLQNLFEIEGYIIYNRHTGTVYLAGPKITVDAAKLSFHLIELSVAEEVKNLRKTMHYVPSNIVSTFKDGIAKTFTERVSALLKEREKNRSEVYGNYLTKTNQKIKDFMASLGLKFDNIKSRHQIVDQSDPIFKAGQRAGENISLHNNKPVDRSRLLE